MLAQWRLVGERSLPLLVDWFYNDDASAGLGNGSSRISFLEALARTPLSRNTVLLRKLAADPRLDRLGWRDLEALIRLANANRAKPLVTESELRDVNSVWKDFRYSDLPRAEKEAPEQTRRILIQLGQWRSILRESFGM